jgi:8-oxo-dGTP pyrophosphatase MutT (NUDIX family)
LGAKDRCGASAGIPRGCEVANHYNAAVIEAPILTAIRCRLDRAQALPPIRYRPFVVAGERLGMIDDARAARLRAFGPDLFVVDANAVVLAERLHDFASRTAALCDVALALRAEGALPGWRDETYAVATTFGAPPLCHMERGAARYFGVHTWAVHVNGVVGEGEAAKLWFARRSATKAVDPNLLDNLVGGGIGAGASVEETVVKESFEEAGIERSLALTARRAGTLQVRRAMFDGLQIETLFVHDLALPREFVPRNQDGEVSEHRLVDLREAARLVAQEGGPDEVTVDASVVVLDYLSRHAAQT